MAASIISEPIVAAPIMNITLEPSATKPTKGSPYAAGYDLYALDKNTIQPGERKMIDTGVQLEIPTGYYGQIAPRSGLAWKNGIMTMAGIIDSDYRGNIKVILYNSGLLPFNISAKDRIAQIIFHRHYNFTLNETNQLCDSQRSSGGFGSTGM